ncbi:MAG TPA: response regulator transcription factor [Thermodesulfobacteriota bacterium]|nr:response regulator transcription factor [Thermodesulfobacteriota bacterium]
MKKILIIDDDLRHDKMMSYLLLSKGFDVTYALSGQEALEKLRLKVVERPDIILMDIMMPQMDGFETFKEIRKEPDLKDTPIIMLTALSDPQNMEKALAIGAADYIEKPFSPSDVIARIKKVVEKEAK